MVTIETRRSAEGITGYRAKVRLKGFPSQSATFERKTDAKQWAKQTEAGIREGRYFKTVEAKKHTDTLGNLQSLRLLDLRDNCLASLPPSIQKLVHLEKLDVSLNKGLALPGWLKALEHRGCTVFY